MFSFAGAECVSANNWAHKTRENVTIVKIEAAASSPSPLSKNLCLCDCYRCVLWWKIQRISLVNSNTFPLYTRQGQQQHHILYLLSPKAFECASRSSAALLAVFFCCSLKRTSPSIFSPLVAAWMDSISPFFAGRRNLVGKRVPLSSLHNITLYNILILPCFIRHPRSNDVDRHHHHDHDQTVIYASSNVCTVFCAKL